MSELEDFKEQKARVVEIAGCAIAVFCTNEQFFAIDNTCPHRGGPLVDGFVEEGRVTCPWHAWSFGLRDGDCDVSTEAKIKTYPVKIEQGKVWIETD